MLAFFLSHNVFTHAIIRCHHAQVIPYRVIILSFPPLLSARDIILCYHPMLSNHVSIPCYHPLIAFNIITLRYHSILSSRVIRVIIPSDVITSVDNSCHFLLFLSTSVIMDIWYCTIDITRNLNICPSNCAA
jgi:hypothetical protein